MKFILILLGIMIYCGPAYAIFAQEPMRGPRVYQPVYGYFDPYSYPYVQSQPIEALPAGYTTISVGGQTFFYLNGVFFQKNTLEQKYLIVPPPIGAVVPRIPEGYQMMFIEGRTYYVYDGVYYKRVLEGYKVLLPPVANIYPTAII